MIQSNCHSDWSCNVPPKIPKERGLLLHRGGNPVTTHTLTTVTKHVINFPLCPLCCLAFRWLLCRSQPKRNRMSWQATSGSATHEILRTLCNRNDHCRPHEKPSQWTHFTQNHLTSFNISFNTVCPTRYWTRHFFNNFTTNEDIATKFEADLPHCVRNVTS